MGTTEIINAAFGPRLNAEGFVPVRARRWARDQKAPIREIFELQALKGATYSARWGFSLDFVPRHRSGGFRWKKTNKECEFDLCIDPIDESGDVPTWCSFVHLQGYGDITPRNLNKIAALTVPKALVHLNRVRSIPDIVDIFTERSAVKFRRFSLDNYAQGHLPGALRSMRWVVAKRERRTS